MAGLPFLQPSKGSSGNQAIAFCIFSPNCLIEGAGELEQGFRWWRYMETLLLHGLPTQENGVRVPRCAHCCNEQGGFPATHYQKPEPSVSHCQKPEKLSPVKFALPETATAF